MFPCHIQCFCHLHVFYLPMRLFFVVGMNLFLKKPLLQLHSRKSGNETPKACNLALNNSGGSLIMFHHFVHRSFSLSDFVANVQEMIKPVLTAYSKVTLLLLRRNSLIRQASMIADCPTDIGWVYVISYIILERNII
jgi:hypothetical protein